MRRILSGTEASVEKDDSFEAGPNPANLVESLRDFGYSLETALADIVDNAIAAGASHVQILARFNDEDSVIGILDDGCGMRDPQLREAMRLASANPLDRRADQDLGRFGMGMKTASFSQCRRMTVLTRQAGETSTAIWDLDEIARSNEWRVLRTAHDKIPWSDRLVGDGTLLVWQDLDRVTGAAGTQQGFDQRLNDAMNHLELVFHRYLSPDTRQKRFRISVNGRDLNAFDPFATSHSACTAGPIEVIGTLYGKVTVQPYTLPHHSRMQMADWERLGGSAGFIKNQGFYVYRARRLIVHGTWFGLAKQSERTKLARVRIDLPNSMDESWKINILKASAEPPSVVRRRLKILIDTIVSSSKRIYTHRGVKQAEGAELPTWRRVVTKQGVRYEPDLNHPVLASLFNVASDEQKRRLSVAFGLLAATLPVDSLLLDMSDIPEQVQTGLHSSQDLADVVTETVNALRCREISWERVLNMLQSSPPFDANWKETLRIVDDMRRSA